MSDEELLKDITKDELTNIELINNTIEKLKDIETTLQKIDDDDKGILIKYYEYLKEDTERILSEKLEHNNYREKGGIIIKGVKTVDVEHKDNFKKFKELLEILDNLNKRVIDISKSYKYRSEYLSQTANYLDPNSQNVSYTYTSLNVLKDNINNHYDKKLLKLI